MAWTTGVILFKLHCVPFLYHLSTYYVFFPCPRRFGGEFSTALYSTTLVWGFLFWEAGKGGGQVLDF